MVACKEQALALYQCMESSECMANGGTLKECLKKGGEEAEQCAKFRTAYYNCRRGMIDRRARLRGPRA